MLRGLDQQLVRVPAVLDRVLAVGRMRDSSIIFSMSRVPRRGPSAAAAWDGRAEPPAIFCNKVLAEQRHFPQIVPASVDLVSPDQGLADPVLALRALVNQESEAAPLLAGLELESQGLDDLASVPPALADQVSASEEQLSPIISQHESRIGKTCKEIVNNAAMKSAIKWRIIIRASTSGAIIRTGPVGELLVRIAGRPGRHLPVGSATVGLMQRPTPMEKMSITIKGKSITATNPSRRPTSMRNKPRQSSPARRTRNPNTTNGCRWASLR